MKTIISEELLKGLPVCAVDAARLLLECIEGLGKRMERLEREDIMRLVRRVIRVGIRELEAEENTVSFKEAAWASVDARKGRRKATLNDLRHFVRRMLRIENIVERPLRAMKGQECRELLEQAFGGSVHSYRKGRAILHSIFAYGIRRGWCTSNPVAHIEIPQAQEKPIIPLTPYEVRQLEKTAAKPEHQGMLLPLQLMLYCGVRPAEMERLRTEDIHWEQKALIIRPQTGKTGGGRVIPIRKIKTQGNTILQGRIVPPNWKKRWKDLRRDAGFSTWAPDVCRHTFASYHAAYFKNLPELQLEMGHRDSSLLRSRYMFPTLKTQAKEFWLGIHNWPPSELKICKSSAP